MNSAAAWIATLALVCACSDADAPADDATASGVTSGAGARGNASAGGGGAAASGGMGGGFGGSGGGGGTMGVPLAGFGSITGECGELDPSELMALDPPFLLTNAIDFGALAYSRDVLSEGGKAMFDDPNAGGSSKESEIIAFEMLYRCELASLLKTETEIVYDVTGALTDVLVSIDGLKVGVSVVRAFKFMAEYTVADALDKMTEKLVDIQESSANVSAEDAWGKQILAVIAEKPENVTAVETALPQIDAGVRGDTIVVITLTNGDDTFIY